MEQEYHNLAARFERREKNVIKDLREYLMDYPYTTYEDEVHYMIGAIQTERGRYKAALRELDQADYAVLSRPHQYECVFYRGYASLMLQQYERACAYFAILARTENVYKQKGAYYFAYCKYKQEKYDEALPDLLKLEQDPAFQSTVPYYLIQIYYAKKNYDEVLPRSEYILETQPDNENAGEVHRILGEIFYQRDNFEGAVRHLSAYTESFGALGRELERNDLYLLGQAQFQMQDYPSAIEHLKLVKQQNDTISESTCLTMGNAYVKLGQTEQAKLSYLAAMNYNISPTLREEAMYNYTLTTYENSTALGESVNAFTAFLKEYPGSKHRTEIYELLSDALRRSRNYAAALEALDNISNPTRKMEDTKQLLRYNLGTDAFMQGKMQDAVQWMSEVLSHSAGSTTLRTDALYWRAEAAYRLHDFAQAERDVITFLSDPLSRQSANYRVANYLRAYTYFSQRRFEDAEPIFNTYMSMTDSADPTYADALNRLGDCAFNNRNFDLAIGYYGQVIGMRATGSDYATFQKGYAEGLLHEYDRKISTLGQLVDGYPRSDYADDGLYEIARAYLQLDNEPAAAKIYEQLLSKYPHSNMARKTSLELAMLYRNMRMYDEAIAAYQNTINTYPASEEAYAALSGLEDIYVETNRVSDYIAYSKTLSGLNMSTPTRDDSLSFAAAELQYMMGNYTDAALSMSAYLSTYCAGGRYCTTAQYYAADSYYRLNYRQEALAGYRKLADITGNPYMEEACTRAAELSYDNKDYQTAMDYFYRMLSVATTKQKMDVARLGVLRCSYYLGSHQATIDIATEILGEQGLTDDVRQEALYNRAKAYVATEKYGMAIVDLTPLSKDVLTRQGAESKYLLAECYYQLTALDSAEDEIMSFMQSKSQQQYWLARALILLSDINLARGEEFQARQYLLSLQANYKLQDDIQSIVKARLNAMDELEKQREAVQLQDENNMEEEVEE